MNLPDLDLEIRILIACTRHSTPAERESELASLLGHSCDWNRLIELAHRHMVLKPLYHHLSSLCGELIDPSQLERLRAECEPLTARDLLLTNEMNKLSTVFKERDIPTVPFKGPALACELYGSIALRQFSDLDFLVQKPDVQQTVELLQQHCYRLKYQRTPNQLAADLKYQHSLELIHEKSQVSVELHWDVVQKVYTIPFDIPDLFSRLHQAAAPAGTLPSLAPEDLPLVLSAHCAKHSYSQLRWLADIEHLLHLYPQLDGQRLVGDAGDLGIQRTLFLTLSLVQQLYGTEPPNGLQALMSVDHKLQKLQLRCRQQLFAEQPLSIWRACWLDVQLRERPLDKALYMLRRLITPHGADWEWVQLPERLFWLYYLIRPVRLARRYLRRNSD